MVGDGQIVQARRLNENVVQVLEQIGHVIQVGSFVCSVCIGVIPCIILTGLTLIRIGPLVIALAELEVD